jgi:Ferritin-like
MANALIKTRAQLMDALRLASELEHQLMCQYLFAVYSLKRYPYERWSGPDQKKEILTEAELERVRRCAMKITLIARQEMEHLGLALNMLSAIGGTPSFSRPNMPQRLKYYGNADIKLELTRGDLKTIKRFQKFEKPDELEEFCKLPPIGDRDVDQECAARWCSKKKGVSPDELMAAFREDDDEDESQNAPRSKRLLGGAPHVDQYGVPFQSVQELYQEIDAGFAFLSLSLGENNLFIGNPQNQIYGGPPSPLYGSMNDLNQYGLSLIAVTDLKSAQQAVRMIIEQGEGATVPPNYLPNTHFCLFTQIRGEMELDGQKLGKLGARRVVPNPMVRMQPDVTVEQEVTIIDNPDTRRVAELFNQCYEVMLLLLLYLYSDQVKSDEQSNGLMDAAFFPFMTMFIRPLAEILTELPAFAKYDPKNFETAGPGFELAGDVVLFPNLEQTWSLFQERIDALVLGFRLVTARRAAPPPKDSSFAATMGQADPVKPQWGWVPRHDPWLKLPSQKFEEVLRDREELWKQLQQEGTTIWPEEAGDNIDAGQPYEHFRKEPPSYPWLRLYYLRQNMERIALNWKSNWLNVGTS